MAIRCEGRDIPDLGATGVRRDLRMAGSAIDVGNGRKPLLAAVLRVTLRATYVRSGMGRIHQLGRMRGAIVALLTGLIGNAAEGPRVADFAALLIEGVRLGKRSRSGRPTASPHAHHQRYACQDHGGHKRPGEPLAQEAEDRRPLQVVQIEPLSGLSSLAMSVSQRQYGVRRD
jgi:hypothetical protein